MAARKKNVVPFSRAYDRVDRLLEKAYRAQLPARDEIVHYDGLPADPEELELLGNTLHSIFNDAVQMTIELQRRQTGRTDVREVLEQVSRTFERDALTRGRRGT